MPEIRIRDEYSNEFFVDASARPFWENRPGCTILDDQPAEPTPQATPSRAAAAAPEQPDVSGASDQPQRGSKKG